MRVKLSQRIAAACMVLFMVVAVSQQDAAASSKKGEGTSAGSVSTENGSVEKAGSSSEKKDASSTSLKEAQDEKKALEKELAAAQSAIKSLKESKGNVEEKVAELNRQLIGISARITELENLLTEKSGEIADTQEDLEEAKKWQAKQYADMKVRIQFMYENRQTSYVNALFSSRDISEFLNAAEYISQIQSYDRQKLTEYEETVQTIADLEVQLEQEYEDLEEMKASVESEKEAVASMMRQKESELAAIADDIADVQGEADYYKAELQAQEELIAAIKRAEAEKAAAGVANNPYTGGVFTWPCPSSTRITSNYGPRTSPTGGASTNHQGIDIGASYGADIVAAAGGTVRAASYSSAAGNYVMIDHGGGLYTVYMHASSLTVSQGQEVSAGQVIAKVGSTGISTGNHLHFGVSLNGGYVSPWSYLGG